MYTLSQHALTSYLTATIHGAGVRSCLCSILSQLHRRVSLNTTNSLKFHNTTMWYIISPCLEPSVVLNHMKITCGWGTPPEICKMCVSLNLFAVPFIVHYNIPTVCITNFYVHFYKTQNLPHLTSHNCNEWSFYMQV